MKNITNLLAIIIIYTITFVTQAQDLESLILKKKIVDCKDVSNGSSEFFAKQIKANNLDSAQITLDYWESKCGTSEPLMRAKIILALSKGEPIGRFLGDEFLWYIFNYLNRIEFNTQQDVNFQNVEAYFGYVRPNGYFDEILIEQFYQISTELEPGTDKFILSNFYALKIPSLFEELQKKQYQASRLFQLYDKEVKQSKKLAEGHIAWLTGLWLPTNKLKTLGSHPDIGLLGGWKKGAWNYDFIMTFKFLKAKNPYLARRTSTNTIVETDHFFGGQIGFELGRDIFLRGPHEIQVIMGLAMDGIDVLERDEDLDLDAESILTYNANVGLGYRYYTNSHLYFGLRAKYNLIDYTINNLINLNGNAFTLYFVIGNVNNIFRTARLKNLEQKIRK